VKSLSSLEGFILTFFVHPIPTVWVFSSLSQSLQASMRSTVCKSLESTCSLGPAKVNKLCYLKLLRNQCNCLSAFITKITYGYPKGLTTSYQTNQNRKTNHSKLLIDSNMSQESSSPSSYCWMFGDPKRDRSPDGMETTSKKLTNLIAIYDYLKVNLIPPINFKSVQSMVE